MGYRAEREELMNRDREPARERQRKAKDHTGYGTEREELKNQGQGTGQRD